MMQKILTIVGARPQFIKASVVSREFKKRVDVHEIILHTGQHFDENMSSVFFEQLNIPMPDIRLNINSLSHGRMTGQMLIEIEEVLQQYRPDRVLVYGDTNSTMAGALAAAKLHIPVAHVESGLRSFNMEMPEEINRIVTDQVSDLLFCPTETSINNLKSEGFDRKNVVIKKTGDVMQDAALMFAEKAAPPLNVDISDGRFILATIHRAENVDDYSRLTKIVEALNLLHTDVAPVLIPIHPRTKKIISQLGLNLQAKTMEPVGYLEMIWLLRNSSLVLTDSGGVQKEAFFFKKPCLTLREQTEWSELVEVGANELVDCDINEIIESAKRNIGRNIVDNQNLYGGGNASKMIVETF